jgi:hypothetical protein
LINETPLIKKSESAIESLEIDPNDDPWSQKSQILSVGRKTSISIKSEDFLEREPPLFQNSYPNLIPTDFKNIRSFNSKYPVGPSLGKNVTSTQDSLPVIQDRLSTPSNKKTDQLVPGQFEGNSPQQISWDYAQRYDQDQGYGHYQYPQDQGYGHYQYPQDQGYGHYQYPQDQGYGHYQYPQPQNPKPQYPQDQGYGHYQYPQDQGYGHYQYPQDQGYGHYQYPQDQGYGRYYYSPESTQDHSKRYEEVYQYNTPPQENQNHAQDYNTTHNKYYNVNISVHQNFSQD